MSIKESVRTTEDEGFKGSKEGKEREKGERRR
jgi:hypothetical protein